MGPTARDHYNGRGSFTEYSLWNQLNSMLGHHESNVNIDERVGRAQLDDSTKNIIRASLRDLSNVFHQLFQASQRLVRDRAEPAIDTSKINEIYTFFDARLLALLGEGPEPTIREPSLAESVEAMLLEDLLHELFQIHLASEMIHELPPAAERARYLLLLAVKDKPSPLARRYLARVARCFT